MTTILVLPGDGIGREVCEAALPALEALRVPLRLEHGDIGWECWRSGGDPVPSRTWEQIARADAVLLGAITSKGKTDAEAELAPRLRGRGLRYVSPVIQLRQRLELFANVRPVSLLAGHRKPFRCCVIRENSEGLYAGLDRRGIPNELRSLLQHPNVERSGRNDVAFSVRLQTRFGLERLFRYGFEYARANGYARVTLADKPNVLRESGQLAADVFHEVGARYSEIRSDVQNVDAVALWLVKRPEELGVIVAENMFGDILSDLAAGVMGGLGVAPSANVGGTTCYFEPVHGSAPTLAGKGRANPSAMFLTISLMLQHLGFTPEAERLESAVRAVIIRGRHVTYDFGGSATTREMADAILDELFTSPAALRASVLCVGDELLRGEIVNSNAAEIGKRLTGAGYDVGLQLACGDQLAPLTRAVESCLGQSDLVVVSGGLGPTSDDRTREAISGAIRRPLEWDAASWDRIVNRLARLGLGADRTNRKQASFPQGAELIPNPNGTAEGFTIRVDKRVLHVLPGPPRECLPMLESILARDPPVAAPRTSYWWRLLGLTEPEVAAATEDMLAPFSRAVEIRYLWRYPYVDVRLDAGPAAGVNEAISSLRERLRPNVVSFEGRSASELLGPALEGNRLEIDDRMAGGRLAGRFSSHAVPGGAGIVRATVSADREFAPPYEGAVTWRCEVESAGSTKRYELRVPHRGPEVVDYGLEFTAWSILRFLEGEEA